MTHNLCTSASAAVTRLTQKHRLLNSEPSTAGNRESPITHPKVGLPANHSTIPIRSSALVVESGLVMLATRVPSSSFRGHDTLSESRYCVRARWGSISTGKVLRWGWYESRGEMDTDAGETQTPSNGCRVEVSNKPVVDVGYNRRRNDKWGRDGDSEHGPSLSTILRAFHLRGGTACPSSSTYRSRRRVRKRHSQEYSGQAKPTQRR